MARPAGYAVVDMAAEADLISQPQAGRFGGARSYTTAFVFSQASSSPRS
jgi:hypothetical protein